MCVKTLELTFFSKRESLTAYKVARRVMRGLYGGIVKGAQRYRVGDVVEDVSKRKLKDDCGRVYRSGFHAYESLRDARRHRLFDEVVLEVRLSHLTAQGYELEYMGAGKRRELNVVVGRRMEIVRVVSRSRRSV